MTDPRTLSINDYTYFLPEEKIASHPLATRDASRLLIYQRGKITDDIYKNIAAQLPENSLVVFNDTRVIEARLVFQKPSGGAIEIFCLEPHEQYAGIMTALMQQGRVLWQCFIGGASKWKAGQLLLKKIKLPDVEILLTAKFIEKRKDSFIIELCWQPASYSFMDILHYAGAVPLPPYIRREAEASDTERYQTVFAHVAGSVAAPTAGLHFTSQVFDSFTQKNIEPVFLTLHVGAGTFKPVKADTLGEHDMHAEFIQVPKAIIERLARNSNRPVIAAGTTSLRTLESLYWMGIMAAAGELQFPMPWLDPWYAYDHGDRNTEVKSSLGSLLDWMNHHKLESLYAKTRLVIAPGYRSKIADGLITNFHQPRSTLLLLVAALIGDDWRNVYAHALENGYRFLSYGDGSLLWINRI
jgi:S-adenosylmethionine:tRNA ribosyltransferase-isomerase